MRAALRGGHFRFPETRRALALLVLAIMATGAVAKDKPLPELSLKDLSGTERKLSDYRGRIVVLNFWATWCGPCQHEFPMLDGVARQYAGKPVTFIAVSIDEKRDFPKIRPFLDEHGIKTVQVWVGGSAELLDRYHLGEIVPATLIVAEDGSVVTRIMGEAREHEIRERLDWLLQGRQGTAPEAVVKHLQ